MTTAIRAVPEGFTEIPLGMINFDHRIDDGFEARLRAEPVWGRHAAMNFNGRVWYANGMFHEQVWRYGSPVAHYEATELRTLMDTVNNDYGWE